MSGHRPPDLRYHSRPGAVLRSLLARRGTMLAGLPPASRRDLEIIHETRHRVPLLMTDAAALNLMACARAARDIAGVMIEAGVFRGASARLICEVKRDRPLHLFDVFEPAVAQHAAQESVVRAHFGPVHGSIAAVRALLASYGSVTTHSGVFPRSAAALNDLPIAFAHLDLDMPASTQAALAFIYPRLAPGGILLGDDYSDPELRRTFDIFFAGRDATIIPLPWSQVLIVKPRTALIAAAP